MVQVELGADVLEGVIDDRDGGVLLLSSTARVCTALDRGASALLAAHPHARRGALAVHARPCDLNAALARHPQAAIALAAVIARILRATTRRIESPDRVRLVRVLVGLDDHPLPAPGVLIRVDLTRVELATLLGVGHHTHPGTRTPPALRAVAPLPQES